MKRLLTLFILLVAVFAAFYVFLVVPNDSRIPRRSRVVVPVRLPRLVWYDFTRELSQASVDMPGRPELLKRLGRYPYKETSALTHTGPLNLHVSLGWYPLKTVHRDCILAPARLQYPAMTLPARAVLTFDYGIVSSIEKRMLGPVTFRVVLKGARGYDQVVFNRTVEPLKPYRWRFDDAFYKNVFKYLRPRLEDREGRWENVSIDLSDYTREPVSVSFEVIPAMDAPILAFWGQPKILVPGPTPPEKNVLLIVVDSMRADHLTRDLAPETARWAGSGVVFRNAYSNGNMTKLSVSSFLTSRYAFEMPEAARQYDMSPDDKNTFYARRFPTLAGTLKAAGFRTAQIGSVSLFSGGHGFAADMGFDESWNLEHSGYSPPHVTDSVIDWLERHGDERFFVMAYYDGPHGPYRPPLKYLLRSLRMKSTPAEGWRDVLYRGEILYHDEHIGRLWRYLRKRGVDKNTIVIVTSDHGVAFRANQYDWPTRYGPWKKKNVRFHSHGVSVTPEDLHVPLAVIDPGRPAGLRSETVQLLDLAPTIVALAGTTPPRAFRGASLVPLLDGSSHAAALTFHQGWLNYGVYADGRYLYVRNTAPRKGFPPETLVPEELFDVVSDSRCRVNLAGRMPVRLMAMRRIAASFMRPQEEVRLAVTGGGSARVHISIDASPARTFSRVVEPGATVSFDVGSPRAVRLRGTINGRPITPRDILVGRSALPLADGLAFTREDLDAAGGWPASLKYLPPHRILIGLVEKSDTAGASLSNAPRQLKSMLEQWGYIQ